jgi:peptide/nickel transport system permease protein
MRGAALWSGRRAFGAAILLGIAGFAVLGPLLFGRDPAEQNLAATLQPPSLTEPLGTDQFGRSVLARLAEAAGVSFGLAALAVLTAAVPGSLLGIAAAWRGGWTERVLSGFADGILAIPGLLLVMLLVSFAPGQFWLLYLAISLTLWVEYFRIVRAVSKQVLGSSPVEATRLLGFGVTYVVRRHLLPEIAPLVLTLMTFGAAGAILAVASLGYINIGLRPPTAELGQMMAEFFPLYERAPWLMAAPVSLLTLCVMGLALLTTGDRPR